MNEAQITQQVWDEYWHSREIFGNSSPIYHNEDTLYANYQSALKYLNKHNQPLYHLVLEFFSEYKYELAKLVILDLADYYLQIPDEAKILLSVLIMVVSLWQKENQSKNSGY